MAATRTPASGYQYNYMYPYLSNQMRTDLNPGVTTSQSTSPINAIVKTEALSAPRRVVARSGVPASAARSATANQMTPAAQRSATTTTGGNNARRVVARSGMPASTARSATANRMAPAARATRGDVSYAAQAAAASPNMAATGAEVWSSARCLADYTECMNGYCQRENTKYNRCYCSAKLSQIDAAYKPAIDSLIKQILTLESSGPWTKEEMNEYWDNLVTKHTGTNSWQKLDDALNIDWAATESRVRGQQAFNTGHEYCVQYLRGCSYMASNLRDVYRSEIARDCASYEQSLQLLKNAAESIVESYSE